MRIDASRRGFLGAGLSGVGAMALAGTAAATPPALMDRHGKGGTEPFFGPHQGGIATPAQKHLYFAAFDVVAEKREEVVALLKRWTEAGARLSAGLPMPDTGGADQAPVDSGEADGLDPARLTLTIGFGPGRFKKDGVDRFAPRR